MADDLTPNLQRDPSTGGTSTPAADPAATPGDPADSATGGKVEDAKQLLRDNAGKVGQQATDTLRGVVGQGKERAGGALDQLAQMLADAADQVDEKLGAQYGGYARQAADQIRGLSGQIKDKDVEELLDDTRALVRKNPAVAVGAAAALGFVVARVVQAGIDDQRRPA